MSSQQAEKYVKEMLEGMLSGGEWHWEYEADGSHHVEVFNSDEFLINRIAYFPRDKHVVPIVWQYRVQGVASRTAVSVKTRQGIPETYYFQLTCVCDHKDQGEDPSLFVALEEALETAAAAQKHVTIIEGPDTTYDFGPNALNKYVTTWRLEVDAR